MTGTNADRLTFIRPAEQKDAGRIAEMFIFNYRLNFYPIFRNDQYYFDDLQVGKMDVPLQNTFVYDDGVVKGFVQLNGQEVRKLFVEPVLQGQGIGAALLEYAVHQHGARFLWALEKNTRAVAFYQCHGFHATGERRPEEDTAEYLIRLER